METKIRNMFIGIGIVTIVGLNFYSDIRSSLGHSFISSTFDGYDIYYKGNKIASTGRASKITYNNDFSEISINEIIYYKNGVKIVDKDENIENLKNAFK